MMTTVRTYKSNGPYFPCFPCTQGVYQAASLKDVLFHVRVAMENGDYLIGIFDSEGKCKGIWQDDAEAIPDGEGGMMLEAPAYELYREHEMSPGMWELTISKFRKP
jgi:hypothetical protein